MGKKDAFSLSSLDRILFQNRFQTSPRSRDPFIRRILYHSLFESDVRIGGGKNASRLPIPDLFFFRALFGFPSIRTVIPGKSVRLFPGLAKELETLRVLLLPYASKKFQKEKEEGEEERRHVPGETLPSYPSPHLSGAEREDVSLPEDAPLFPPRSLFFQEKDEKAETEVSDSAPGSAGKTGKMENGDGNSFPEKGNEEAILPVRLLPFDPDDSAGKENMSFLATEAEENSPSREMPSRSAAASDIAAASGIAAASDIAAASALPFSQARHSQSLQEGMDLFPGNALGGWDFSMLQSDGWILPALRIRSGKAWTKLDMAILCFSGHGRNIRLSEIGMEERTLEWIRKSFTGSLEARSSGSPLQNTGTDDPLSRVGTLAERTAAAAGTGYGVADLPELVFRETPALPANFPLPADSGVSLHARGTVRWWKKRPPQNGISWRCEGMWEIVYSGEVLPAADTAELRREVSESLAMVRIPSSSTSVPSAPAGFSGQGREEKAREDCLRSESFLRFMSLYAALLHCGMLNESSSGGGDENGGGRELLKHVSPELLLRNAETLSPGSCRISGEWSLSFRLEGTF